MKIKFPNTLPIGAKSLGQTQLSAVEALSNLLQCKGSLLPRDEPHPNAYGSVASERVLTEK